MIAAPASAEADDGEFTKVCLNLGRSHGHKAATIRGLLRDHLGLEGRAIRDLTVRDADTLFRVHADEVPRIQEALTQVREGQVQLAIQPASDDAEDVLRAPPPDAIADVMADVIAVVATDAEPTLTGADAPADTGAAASEPEPAHEAASEPAGAVEATPAPIELATPESEPSTAPETAVAVDDAGST